MQWMTFPAYNAIPTIEITSFNWYNPTMNYKEFMVPGILVILLTMIGISLASLNIVYEKKLAPLSKSMFHPLVNPLLFWVN